MRQEKAPERSDKAKLHERLKKLSKEWGTKTGLKNVSLDAFIISTTPYHEPQPIYADGSWKMKRFEDAHILFFDKAGHYDYIERLFT